MILAYYNKDTELHIALLNDEREILIEKHIPSSTKSRADILQEIAQLLKQTGHTPAHIRQILLCPGPGKFTAVRTACIIGNIFAKNVGAKTSIFSPEIYEKYEEKFSKILKADEFFFISPVKPLFASAPRIG